LIAVTYIGGCNALEGRNAQGMGSATVCKEDNDTLRSEMLPGSEREWATVSGSLRGNIRIDGRYRAIETGAAEATIHPSAMPALQAGNRWEAFQG
jgi:hypothetical protein